MSEVSERIIPGDQERIPEEKISNPCDKKCGLGGAKERSARDLAEQGPLSTAPPGSKVDDVSYYGLAGS